MLSIRPVIIAPLAALALLAPAGCGTAAPSSAPPAAPARSASSAAVTAESCRQQYETWKHRSASAALARVKAADRQLIAAGNSDDLPAMTSGLARIGRAARVLRAHPVPRCADPHGYYARFTALLIAAGDNARSSGGSLGGLILAEVPLKQVPGVEKKLNAELNRTVGKKR